VEAVAGDVAAVERGSGRGGDSQEGAAVEGVAMAVAATALGSGWYRKKVTINQQQLMQE